jgi:hypothetical protein
VAAAASELAGALGGAASRSLAGDRTRRRIRSAALAPPQRCNHVCSARKASSSGTCAVGLPPARTACVGGDTGMGIVEGMAPETKPWDQRSSLIVIRLRGGSLYPCIDRAHLDSACVR